MNKQNRNRFTNMTEGRGVGKGQKWVKRLNRYKVLGIKEISYKNGLYRTGKYSQ